MPNLEALRLGVNLQNVVFSMLVKMESRITLLETSSDKRMFTINRRICEELLPVIWMTIDKSGYEFPSEFKKAVDDLEERFEEVSSKLTKRFKEDEETVIDGTNTSEWRLKIANEID